MTGRSNTLLITSAATIALVAVSTVWLIQRNKKKHEAEKVKKELTADLNEDLKLDECTEANKKNPDYVVSPDAPVREINLLLGGDDNDNSAEEKKDGSFSKGRVLTRGSITIVHGSVTGTCAKMARDLYEALSLLQTKSSTAGELLQWGSMEDWDWWDELVNDEGVNEPITNQASPPAVLIVLLPTFTNGTWPPCATSLESALQDLQTDWRVEQSPLKKKLQVAVFGMGSSEYDTHDSAAAAAVGENSGTAKIHGHDHDTKTMGRPARQAVRYFQKLGAKSIVRLRIGDDAVGDHAHETFEAWKTTLLQKLNLPTKSQQQKVTTITKDIKQPGNNSNKESVLTTMKDKSKCSTEDSCACAADESKKQPDSSLGCCQSNNDEPNQVSSIQEEDEEVYDSDDEDDDEQEEQGEPQVMDLEDLGDAVKGASATPSTEVREMVTPRQAKALKKEGYRLIGTHSAVKLCRWTKHQLRGRGGCYKHTFYGITSYQCMEATPSLACANKCVFCWRHHKNPVGKEWRWKTDDPYYIVDEAIKAHINMIKETKGIPGVRLDRWKEAHTVKHCALSLVGEPIMYPRIDELLADLHSRKISTFLVTNGQHPGAIGSLRPVTQLYVSVDAPTQETLIAIDRPLFQDAWERLKQSLESLKDKGQRTVARLTVVKGWNSDEVEGYAQLIALGRVSLVEVKGVTFCGKSDASNLNMTNTPWHHEVVELTRNLKKELDKLRSENGSLPEYDLACEHKHSCSVLLARVDQFTEPDSTPDNRKWRTWIDYDKFHELAARHAQDSSFTFGVQEYTAPTPSWALFGAEEEGFDPTDTRHRRQQPMYTQFDERGVPTHDHNHQELSEAERQRLAKLMEERQRQVGTGGSTVTELKGGAKEVRDPSLMFRGLVIAKK